MKVLLVGNPNVGKSAIFTQLTGVNARTSNYPGTTVSYTSGTLTVVRKNPACASCSTIKCKSCHIPDTEKIEVIDVPGIYRLDPECEAEQVACRLMPEGDIYVNVVDATNLERNLNLTLQLLEFKKPVIIALNMWDDTIHKGISIDVDKLSEMLGVPVVTTTGITGAGVDKLIQKILHYPKKVTPKKYKNRWQAIGEIVTSVQSLEHRHHTFLERLQDISVHPLAGIPIAIAIIIALFQVIIVTGEFLVGLMEQLFDRYYTPFILFLSRLLGGGGLWHEILLGDISADKIDYEAAMGVLTTGIFMELGLVFPYILIFYLVLGFLEDLGYLPRIAVLFDRFMHKVGLHGFSIIPMMLALGCNVPGVMAIRNLESRRQRFITATLTAITIPCMAQSAIIFSLTASYGTGHVIAILITIMALWVVLGSFLRLTVKGTTDTLIMEIPPYRLPGFKVLMRNLGTRLYEFLTDAFPYVLGGILFVNILTMLGVMDFLGNLAKPVISGVFGLPSEAVSSYLIGIVRKDASVALLEPLALNGVQMITGVTTLIIYFPCMATFVVLLKELGFKDTAKSMLIMVEVTILTGTWVRLTMLIVHNSPWLYTLVTALFAITVMVVANRKAMQKSSESL
ncbi:MAG: ferrous iron transporter B [Clostridiaceae bacterium]|nr:ferrous iron transporter B [Clostridiaceae bacterium]